MFVLVPDISSALQLLEHIQLTINESDDVKLIAQATDDLNFLISSLGNPILRSIVTIQVRTSFYLLLFYCLVHACLCRSERLIKPNGCQHFSRPTKSMPLGISELSLGCLYLLW